MALKNSDEVETLSEAHILTCVTQSMLSGSTVPHQDGSHVWNTGAAILEAVRLRSLSRPWPFGGLSVLLLVQAQVREGSRMQPLAESLLSIFFTATAVCARLRRISTMSPGFGVLTRWRCLRADLRVSADRCPEKHNIHGESLGGLIVRCRAGGKRSFCRSSPR